MLLTTLALVKRKVGKLPNRRNKLYSEAVSVLLNWNPRHYKTIEEDEALPQLEYLAYEMCQRGVQRLTDDDVLYMLERLRIEYPHVRAIQRQKPEAFLEHLEARSSILIKSGSIWQNNQMREKPVWEFRHLTFQEYLAAHALLEGHYPGHDKKIALDERVAPLAGQVEKSKHCLTDSDQESDVEISESWRETLRLLVTDCKDDYVDDVVLAMLNPLPSEDSEKTGRPRAGLAALSLADEPNVSEEVAQHVLSEFARRIDIRDGLGRTNTSFDSTAIEVFGSIWAPLLRKCLIDEFRRRPSETRTRVGGLFGLAEVKQWRKLNFDSRKCFNELVQNLKSENRDDALAAALIVMQAAFEQKAIIHPGLIKALFVMLSEGPLERHAGAWALYWLNGGMRRPTDRQVNWVPTEEEVSIMIGHLEKASVSEGHTRRILKTIITNVGRDKVKLVTGPFLLTNITSSDPDVRYAVVTAIGNIADSEALESLLNLLSDPDHKVRRAVVITLGKLRDKRALATLLALLEDENNLLRGAAVQALGNLGDPGAVAPLINQLNDPDNDVRRAVVTTLGKLHDKRALEPLLDLLKDENNLLRGAAAQALGNLGDPGAVAPLINQLNDSDNEVRRNTAKALGKLEDEQSFGSLINLLKDDDIDVQGTVVNILEKIKNPKLIDHLIANIDNDNVVLQEMIRCVLSDLAKEIFTWGETDRALKIFKLLHEKKSDEESINNLLYCYIVLGKYNDARYLQTSVKFIDLNRLSLFIRHNLGILEFLSDEVEKAAELLQKTLRLVGDMEPPSTFCMLLLDGYGHVTSEKNMPFEAACLLNLYRTGAMTFENVSEELYKRFPNEHSVLISKLNNK